MVKDLMLAETARPTAPSAKPAKTDALKQKAFIVAIALALMWGLEVIDIFLGGRLDGLGIEPRTATGLIGIPLAPFLHGGFGHLIANTIPFAVLAFLTILRGVSTFVLVSAVVAVVGGLAVWIFGSNGFHIGASGLIFGYFGYNMAMGIFERSFKSIALTVLVLLLYGSMVFGVLPGRPGVSWEGHLFGAAAGVGWAWLVGRKAQATKAKS